MNREEWLKLRQNGIGASDAASILGKSSYMTNQQLYKIKTGEVVPENKINEKFRIYGTEAEKHLRELFKLDHPQYTVQYSDFDMVYHPSYNFLFATLDGRLIAENGKPGILEIKTCEVMNGEQRKKWNNRIPDNYFIQVLHQLLVTGCEFAILKAQLKSTWNDEIHTECRHYTIKREDVQADMDYLLKKELKFWDMVTNKNEPGLILPEI